MTTRSEAQVAGNELLRSLAASLPAELGVSVGRMFNGQGLQTNGRFFAFVNTAGMLVVKLPEQEVRQRVDAGEFGAVTMGARTMREWASLPQASDGDPTRWRDAIESARLFAV